MTYSGSLSLLRFLVVDAAAFLILEAGRLVSHGGLANSSTLEAH